jgi:hypothetical protein
MRKMMMAALFTVLCLSACGVTTPNDPQDGDQIAIDESDDPAPEATTQPERERADELDLGDKAQDLPPVLSAQACTSASDCWSNVCDFEKHVCREYPF